MKLTRFTEGRLSVALEMVGHYLPNSIEKWLKNTVSSVLLAIRREVVVEHRALIDLKRWMPTWQPSRPVWQRHRTQYRQALHTDQKEL